MTREEAIWAMQFYKEKLYNGIFNQYIEAFDMAISALREQEKRSKGCEHCLSEVNKSMMLAHGYACCTDCGRRLEEV